MHFGVTMFMTDQTMRPDDFARAVEVRDLHSIYVPEHTHIPVSRRTPPPTGDAQLAEEYKRTLDPFVALAMAATATERVLVGTGICLVAQREPIVTAKAVATLDALSGGRFVFGVGFGWNADEIEHHGVAMPERRDVAREHMLAMQELWREDQAEYHGKYVDLAPSWSWPKPARRPGAAGPPVLIGGAAGPKMFAQSGVCGWLDPDRWSRPRRAPELHAACEAIRRIPTRCLGRLGRSRC